MASSVGARGRLACALAAVIAIASVGAPAARAAGLDFDRVFSISGEPSRLTYTASFRSHGASHRVDVWRDGDRRLKRVADHAVATYASHSPGAPDYRLVVVDDRRKIITQIDRSHLYRLGNFTDWFDLGHALRHPKGRYRLSIATPPGGDARAIRPCRWYALVEPERVSRLCWDPRLRLPLLIVSSDGVVQWRVMRASEAPFSDAVFRLPTTGYIRNDADRDIERD